jgi:hypothetical protein
MKFRFVFWDVLPRKIIVDHVSEVRAASIIRAMSDHSQKTNLNFGPLMNLRFESAAATNFSRYRAVCQTQTDRGLSYIVLRQFPVIG